MKHFSKQYWNAPSWAPASSPCKNYDKIESTKSRIFFIEATFGPRDIFKVFRACEDGEIQINTDTPLAKELLDVQDNGVEIFFSVCLHDV